MRHHNAFRKLNRTSSHRIAMFRNMTNSLLKHEIIKTTLPKAKELRSYAEPMITLGKISNATNKRKAFDKLRDREIVTKLFSELGPRYAERPGGYIRILKYGFRKGDNAPMALVELVDRPVQPEAREAMERLYWPLSDSSFPSNAITGLAAAAAGLWVANRRASLILWGLVVAWGFGRVYVGIHYPLDIVGGMLLGIGCAFVGLKLMPADNRLLSSLQQKVKRLLLA